MTDFVLPPWHLLVAIVAGAVNREQQQAIEHLRPENQVLKEKMVKKRILLNDDHELTQRRPRTETAPRSLGLPIVGGH